MAIDRRPKLIVDAIGAIDAATGFVRGRTLEQYEADLMLRSAVERQVEILGEACSRLGRIDESLTERAPAARLAIGMRNRIIHGYDAVDDETVFETVGQHLAGLRAALQQWLEEIAGPARSP
jgi:uncharacterized protein with HEPN domain